MGKLRKLVGVTLSVVGVTACGDLRPQPAEAVPVSLVINSLKCGFAKAVNTASPRAGIVGAVAKVELHLNVLSQASLGSNVKIDPGILLFQGVSIGPSFVSTVDRKYTIATQVNFQISLAAPDTSICDAVDPTYGGADVGFGAWLLSVMSEVEHAKSGPPLATITNYTYETDFALTRKSSSGIEAGLVAIPLNLGATRSSERDDCQHLKVTIDTVEQRWTTKTVNGKPVRVPTDQDSRPFLAPTPNPPKQ